MTLTSSSKLSVMELRGGERLSYELDEEGCWLDLRVAAGCLMFLQRVRD